MILAAGGLARLPSVGMRSLIAIPLLATAAGCSVLRPSPVVIQTPALDWRLVATASDRARLREWRGAFTSALKAARDSGHQADIAREGALLQPDSAIAAGPIPNGMYRCRVTKLGARSQGMLDYVAYPPFRCRIRQDGVLQEFAKLSGSQRYVGTIFPGDMMRHVFLGTLVLGDEQRAMHYGRDQERDVAAYIERIGSRRWRMLMPRPHFESQFDVVELVPETAGGN